MSNAPSNSIVLSAEHAEFIQGPLAIDLATRDRRNFPRVARCIGCRVTPDRKRITLIVANRLLERFMDALQETRAIAAVFCLASKHHAIQIKGSDAVVEAAQPTDQALVERLIAGAGADFVLCGFDEGFVRGEMTYRPAELVAISFSPDAVFEQTPGPQAGTAIQRGSADK